MNELFQQNYEAVVKRGLINKETNNFDFRIKLIEEMGEVNDAYIFETPERTNEEITDCLVVCASWLIHRGANIEEEVKKVLIKNQNRAKCQS
jgi:NTP pyrophosphatase (non-canonical NTP hydrolase)